MSTGDMFEESDAQRAAAAAIVGYCACGAIFAMGVTHSMDRAMRASIEAAPSRGGRVVHTTVAEARKLRMSRCACRK